MHGELSFWRNIARIAAIVLAVQCPVALGAEIEPFNGPPLEQNADSGWGVGYTIRIGEQQFDLAQIEGMPAYQATIKTPWGESGTFVGVKFIDLLNQAGIKDFQRLMTMASNDYKVTIASDDTGLDKALLAYRLNDSLLGLNNKGPYWLVWPHQAEALLSGVEPGTKWIWSVIEVRKVR